MAEWSKNKVDSSAINNGKEFTSNDNLAINELNAIVNNSFYATNKADSAEAIAKEAKETVESAVIGSGTSVTIGGISQNTWSADFVENEKAISGADNSNPILHKNDIGNLDLELDNYYTKDETYSKSEVDDKIAGAGGGSSIVVDSELSSTSENPVQNKVLYDPVSFAESERQKSKNLLYLYDFSFSYGGISFNNSESEQTLKITGTSTVANESQIGTIEPLALKAGHTYYFSWDIVSGTADINYIALYSSEIGRYTDLFVRNSQFTPTKDITYDSIRVWISGAGKTSDCVTKLQVTEDSSASEWQFPYGAIVHEKDVADVEHVEVLYNMHDTAKQTIGNTAYTSGIIGTDVVSGADFSKYKRLIIYVTLAEMCLSYVIDFSHIVTWSALNISDIYTGGGFAISKDKSNLLCHSSYVNKDKTSLKFHAVGYLLPSTTFADRSTHTGYYVHKIEGVLA